jgi:hypothetical protein
MVIESARGDDRVKANYLPTTLSSAVWSWLINLPGGSIYNEDQVCARFIENFQGTYEHPSIIETLKTIKQKHDESLWDYEKHFYITRNTIPYIQDMEIINAFRDEVSDVKTVEEITMKKARTMADPLAAWPEPGSLNHVTRGHRGRWCRTIRRSTQQIIETITIFYYPSVYL